MAKDFQELLEDLKSGRDSRESQEELYRRVATKILELLRARLPLKAQSRIDAEDVLHEAFLRSIQGAPEAHFETEERFFAWVYRIARNLMTDQSRRMSAQAVPFARGTESNESPGTPRESRIAGRERSPETAIQRKEQIEKILCQMHDNEAEVIRRRWLAGESFEELASSLQKSHVALKSLYARAWRRFRQLARRGEGE